MTRLTAFLLAFATVMFAPSPMAAADPGLEIQFPWDTYWVDADANNYVIQVDDQGAGQLYAEWQGTRQLLPRTGSHTMKFEHPGSGHISIVRCVGEPQECTGTGVRSPDIQVYGSLGATIEGMPKIVAPGAVVRLTATSERLVDTEVEVAWDVTRGSGGLLTARREVLRGDGFGVVSFDVRFPRSVPDEDYHLSVSLSALLPPFGVRSSGAFATVHIDSERPVVEELRVGDPVIYPVRDGYRDRTLVSGEVSEFVDGKVELLRGTDVVRTSSWRDGFRYEKVINGRDAADRLLPAGQYTVRVTATDGLGQTATRSKPLTISHKRLVKKTFTRTISARAALKSKTVGSCATLRVGGSRGWAGALGLHSRPKCTSGSHRVRLYNQVPVPAAYRLETVRISTYGGGARGAGGGAEAALEMLYLNRGGGASGHSRLDGRVGLHHGRTVRASAAITWVDGRPTVHWRAWVDGSRYDVKSYTVKLTYTVLA